MRKIKAGVKKSSSSVLGMAIGPLLVKIGRKRRK